MDGQPQEAGGVDSQVKVKLDGCQVFKPRTVGPFGHDSAVGLFDLSLPTQQVVGLEEDLPAFRLGPKGGVAFRDRNDVDPGWLVGDGQDLRLRLAGMRQEAWREGPTCKGFPDPAQGLPGALRLV